MHFWWCICICFVLSCVINAVDSVGFSPPALSCNETELCCACVSHLKGQSQGTSCPSSHSSYFTVLAMHWNVFWLCLAHLYFCCFPPLFYDYIFFVFIFILADTCMFSSHYQLFQEPKSECICMWFSAETQFVSALPVRPCFRHLSAWYANARTHLHHTQSSLQHK